MRRIVFLTLGILELVVAAILVYLGVSLPRPSAVGAGFDRVAKTTLGTGRGETAKYLDDSVIPISGRAADQLDESAASLGKDAEKLSSLLKEAAPDLKAAREVHDSLGRFNEGLEKMLKLLELKRLDAIKEGFSGLETSLSTTAGGVERPSGHTYPKGKV